MHKARTELLFDLYNESISTMFNKEKEIMHENNSQIIIYQTESGETKLDVRI